MFLFHSQNQGELFKIRMAALAHTGELEKMRTELSSADNSKSMATRC